MIAPLTPNTQAILLLTAPLIVGRGGETSPDLLSLREYNRLARILREKQKQPADLIASNAGELIEACAQCFGRERLESLLGRGFLLSQAIERWNARAIWVISRADNTYPRRIKGRLKEDAPPVLYGCGEVSLLDMGGLAVVGSRHVDDEMIRYTEHIGQLTAEARRTLVSGGAKGIDRAAMHGALQAGGRVMGVMADSLERAALASDNREPLMDQKLIFVSLYDPAAGFNVGHAMQRNKIIYALADAALVVTADFGKGGTWAGAIEQLQRLHFVPIFVRNGSNAGKGNDALLRQGALPWPNLHNGAELSQALATAESQAAAEPRQEPLALVMREEPSAATDTTPTPAAYATTNTIEPADELLKVVGDILSRELAEPRSESEVVELLAISKSQAKTWLTKLVKVGVLEKTSKPIRYRRPATKSRLL